MVDLVSIFKNNPEKYDLLVSKEDYKNNLLNLIFDISKINKKSDILDMGCGTGRISFMISDYVNKIHAFDINQSMIDYGKRKSSKQNISNIVFDRADNTRIPLKDNYVDLSIEAWAFMAMHLFSDENPIVLMKKAVKEMERITKEGGCIILIETQGTCVEAPIFLDRLVLKILTEELEFNKKIIETDYKFDSLEQAAELIGFFFGDKEKQWVEKNSSPVVKEFTGVWWKYL